MIQIQSIQDQIIILIVLANAVFTCCSMASNLDGGIKVIGKYPLDKMCMAFE